MIHHPFYNTHPYKTVKHMSKPGLGTPELLIHTFYLVGCPVDSERRTIQQKGTHRIKYRMELRP